MRLSAIVDKRHIACYDTPMRKTQEEKRAYWAGWREKNRARANAYVQAYRSKPEVKAKIKEKMSTPEARAKRLEYSRIYRAKNRAKLNAKALAWRAAHQETANASARISAQKPERKLQAKLYRDEHRKNLSRAAREWRTKNKDRVNAARKARYERLRSEALSAYGNKCACCGETHPHFLSIDHINGGGKTDRATHGDKNGGMNWYKYLATERPSHVQVLCHNCNMAKGHYGICPHQIKEA